MTCLEVKETVKNEIERMNKSTTGCATNRLYRMGKVNGMLKAFEIAGVISYIEWVAIFDQLEELI